MSTYILNCIDTNDVYHISYMIHYLVKFNLYTLEMFDIDYLWRIPDAKFHIDAKKFGDFMKERNYTNDENQAKTMIILRHHFRNGKIV